MTMTIGAPATTHWRVSLTGKIQPEGAWLLSDFHQHATDADVGASIMIGGGRIHATVGIDLPPDKSMLWPLRLAIEKVGDWPVDWMTSNIVRERSE